MPELPEVETIARNLRLGTPANPSLIEKEITGAELTWHRTLAYPNFPEFQSRITGQAIHEIGRRGKFLLFTLSQDTLLMHLRMSGDIFVQPATVPAALHDRLILYLTDHLRLALNDARKFGRVWLLSNPQEVLGPLGPEPLSSTFTPQWLYLMLRERKRQLKPLLLDQTFIAGLGNIYADEALHLARLHPLALSHQLNYPQAEELWRSIRQVLEEGIRRNGASIDWVYRGGDFQNYFRVYQRTGEPCPVCGTPIERILVGQRGTHYCPVCQTLQD